MLCYWVLLHCTTYMLLILPWIYVYNFSFQLNNATAGRKYTISLYRAVSQTLSVGYGYAPPYETIEIWVSFSCYLCSFLWKFGSVLVDIWVVFCGNLGQYLLISGKTLVEIWITFSMNFGSVFIELLVGSSRYPSLRQCWTDPSCQNDIWLCGSFVYFHSQDAFPVANSW